MSKGNIRPMSNLIDMGVFPGTQGGPLEHVIAAKAVSFGEILSEIASPAMPIRSSSMRRRWQSDLCQQRDIN
jgi:hypothetical protein